MTFVYSQWNIIYRQARYMACALLTLVLVALVLIPEKYYAAHHLTRIDVSQLISYQQSHVFILYRHAERCDRSSHKCEGNEKGITVKGAQRATDLGITLRRHYPYDYTLMSSNTLRTEQSARFFGGNSAVMISGKLDNDMCNNKQFGNFLQALEHSSINQMHIAFTHSECLAYIAERFAHKNINPRYLSNLVLTINREHKVHVIGSLAINDQAGTY